MSLKTNVMKNKAQRCSDVELEVQRMAELEAQEREALEKRYTLDDLNFAWEMGYESRVREEREEGVQEWRWSCSP